MSLEHDAASHVKDFISGLKASPNMPNLKTVVGKLSALPGLAQFKGIQIQMLRVQEELLKGQVTLIQQLIQALEATPDPPAAPESAAAPETPANGKIIIS